MKRVRYVGVPDPRVAHKAKVKELLALYAEDEAAGIPHAARRGISEANVWKENTKRLGGSPETGPFPVVAAIPGVTSRILGPKEGLSRRVKWGPKPASFVQEVSNADWEAIRRLVYASHFELVEDEPAAQPDEQPESPAEGE